MAGGIRKRLLHALMTLENGLQSPSAALKRRRWLAISSGGNQFRSILLTQFPDTLLDKIRATTREGQDLLACGKLINEGFTVLRRR
jgi:hypothetical protein